MLVYKSLSEPWRPDVFKSVVLLKTSSSIGTDSDTFCILERLHEMIQQAMSLFDCCVKIKLCFFSTSTDVPSHSKIAPPRPP